MASMGNRGGVESMGGHAGAGGSDEEDPPPFPGHAATICDPRASYGSPFQSPGSRTATRLSESYFFTEGPVWIAAAGYLLFTDMHNAAASPYVPGAHVERFTPPSTFDTFILDSDSNGLALSTDGLTLFAARRIKENTDDGEIASYLLSSKARATVLESPVSPNDLTVRSDENLFFSDGDVHRIDPDGDVTTAVQVDSQSANGVTLSPDESTLYTGWSDGTVYASALGAGGLPAAPAPFATLQDGGHPDGMAVDCAGNLYVADYTNGTVQVFDSRGTYVDRITLPAASASSPPAEHATNVAFGGIDHRTLFITGHRGDWNDPAIGELHSIALSVPGLPY
jgi:gluconolactonase